MGSQMLRFSHSYGLAVIEGQAIERNHTVRHDLWNTNPRSVRYPAISGPVTVQYHSLLLNKRELHLGQHLLKSPTAIPAPVLAEFYVSKYRPHTRH